MEALSEITNRLSKRQKTDPLWNLLDEIDNKRYCQLCRTNKIKIIILRIILIRFKLIA